MWIILVGWKTSSSQFNIDSTVCISHVYHITVLRKWLGGGLWEHLLRWADLLSNSATTIPRLTGNLVAWLCTRITVLNRPLVSPRLGHRRCWPLDPRDCDSATWYWILESAFLTGCPGGPEAGSAQTTVGAHWPWTSFRVHMFPVIPSPNYKPYIIL